MVNGEIEKVTEILLRETVVGVRGSANIKVANDYFWRNREGLTSRVREFETATSTLSTYLNKRPVLDSNLYKNVVELRDVWERGQDLASFTEEFAICEAVRQDDPEQAVVVEAAWREIRQNILSDEQEFVRSTSDPGKLASVLLIEGYGFYIQRVYAPFRPDLARTLVLSLEEILLITQPESQILKDVIGWMKQEKDEFGPKIVKLLEEM